MNVKSIMLSDKIVANKNFEIKLAFFKEYSFDLCFFLDIAKLIKKNGWKINLNIEGICYCEQFFMSP